MVTLVMKLLRSSVESSPSMSKFSTPMMSARDEQFWNIEFIVVADEVSNPDTSRDVRDEQLKNIEFIVVADEVSNPDTSRDVRDEQL